MRSLSADEVDDAGMRGAQARLESREFDVLYRAWEAWGIWANGGFEAVLTGGMGDERELVLPALAVVGAEAERRLFERAYDLLPPGLDIRQRSGHWDDQIASAASDLDDAMTSLPDFKERFLGPFIESSQSLRHLLE